MGRGWKPGPLYPIGPVPARWGAVSQIYESVTGRDPPLGNITSEAIQAYYSGVEAWTVKSWACQVLCMITEYHMACVTRGVPITSPILPGIIEAKLPPLAGYAPPEDRSGITDVCVRDHSTKTLRVAIWLHQLDMALSGEPGMSGSLVWARHSLRHLLAYFLAPGTAWGLRFEDVVDHVLRENRVHNERRWNEASSSLRKCLSQRAKLGDELDAVNKALEITSAGPACLKLEKRLHAIHTSLSAVEKSVAKFENQIEESRILEDEAHQMEKEASQDQPGPGEEAADNPQQAPDEGRDVISPEEENALLRDIPRLEDSSPGSETAVVSGGMVELRLRSPGHPGTEEGETS